MTTISETESATANPQLVAHLDNKNPFYGGYRERPMPVFAAFGVNDFHQYTRAVKIKVHQLVEENSRFLARSFRRYFDASSGERWEDCLFRFSSDRFLYADHFQLIGYAPDDLALANRHPETKTESYETQRF